MRDPESSRSYLKNLDDSLVNMQGKLRHFRALESTLDGLDNDAWRHLKAEVAPLLVAQDKHRDWQALFDVLNHAKAYGYLKRIGCTNIRFVVPATGRGKRATDIAAEIDANLILCEVKTINAPQEEIKRRKSGDAGTSNDSLGAGFFVKLAHDLNEAREQMIEQANGKQARMLVYVIVNFDDYFHEYADHYRPQIEEFLVSNTPPGLEVILDVKEAFGV